MGFFLTAAEEVVEESTEIMEEVLQYNIDDVYQVLSKCLDKLSAISVQLEKLQKTGENMLKFFQSSDLDFVCALLLLLVLFKLHKIVKSWLKGVRHGRIS